MQLSNDTVFSATELIEEEEIPLLMDVGIKLARLAKKLKIASLTSNQVGMNKNLFVLEDGGPCNNFTIYANLVIGEPEESSQDMISLPRLPNITDIPCTSASFPHKRLLLPMKDIIHISVYDINEEERHEVDVSGGEAIIWQGIDYHLRGVDEQDMVDPDFRTIRRQNQKKSRNARCKDCGQKIKRCRCDAKGDAQ